MPQRVCPKCGREQPIYHTECVQCGIIFDKFNQDREAAKQARLEGTLEEPEPRVRPLTLVLLLAYLALGAYAIHYFDVIDKLAILQGGEEGISSGGSFTKRSRQRITVVETSIVEGVDQQVCLGIPVYPQASLVSDRTGEQPTLGITHYEIPRTLDDVVAFYEGLLGPARLKRIEIPVTPDYPIADTLGAVRGRRAHWGLRCAMLDGSTRDVDLALQNPFFDDDGSFFPGTTLITFVDVSAPPAEPSAAP